MNFGSAMRVATMLVHHDVIPMRIACGFVVAKHVHAIAYTAGAVRRHCLRATGFGALPIARPPPSHRARQSCHASATRLRTSRRGIIRAVHFLPCQPASPHACVSREAACRKALRLRARHDRARAHATRADRDRVRCGVSGSDRLPIRAAPIREHGPLAHRAWRASQRHCGGFSSMRVRMRGPGSRDAAADATSIVATCSARRRYATASDASTQRFRM